MAKTKWDDESNEATNNFVSWGKKGDFILGTFTETRKVKSKYPEKGEWQNVYDFLVKECEFHKMNEETGVAVEPAIILNEGDFATVGGRPIIDSRMKNAKIGQIIGIKFVDSTPNKGAKPTKQTKVFFPKNEKGEYEMNDEWLKSREVVVDDEDWDTKK